MDMSGKLGFEDYKRLWADLLLCKVRFLSSKLVQNFTAIK